ncbi:MAG: metal ABC transporter substrate-binding protein [Pseudomonadota bacterium]
MAQLVRQIAVLALVFGFTDGAVAQDRAQIFAVNKALQYFAQRLIGDDADVVFPVPEGVDPSFWRPSINDISAIQSSDLILLNGAGFATWIDRVSLPRSRLVNTGSAFKDQLIVTESITHSHGDGGEHSHDGLASYTWLDPILAIAQADAVAGALAGRALAPPEDVYARFADLRDGLEQLDRFALDALLPAQGVAMIATHPRYQYFARRYGLSVTSLEWEAGAMPSEAELAELGNLASAEDARVLIWEAEPPVAAKEAAAAMGLKNVVFEPWAGAGSGDSFIDAYRGAVSDLAEAVRQVSN